MMFLIAAVWTVCPGAARAEFAAPGQGLRVVLAGALPNAGLYRETSTHWVNGAVPAKPYLVTHAFTLPECEAIPVARLVLTVWGGNASYTSHLSVAINGTNLPAANPLVFGTAADTNTVFSAVQANAYGSGSGAWLVTLPVPGEMLLKNGQPNSVAITQTTPDSFDGRVHHMTLVAVYQDPALRNQLEYAIAEGSGDIYRTPSGAQTDQRTLNMTVNPTNATAARLNALYTYGDWGQNDRLYFNGVPLGGDDVAGWDKVGTGLDFGPSIVSFDVLANLAAANDVQFTVAGGELPDPRESTLRPQLALLAVTRTAAAMAPTLSVDLATNLLQVTLFGESGRTYTVLTSSNLTAWSEADSFVSTNAVTHWSVPVTGTRQYLRVRSP
jgi:hypothetical protein